jgi:hypothetical protein
MLERRTLDGVLGLLRQTPVCSSGNYVLCDGAGRIADVNASWWFMAGPVPLSGEVGQVVEPGILW